MKLEEERSNNGRHITHRWEENTPEDIREAVLDQFKSRVAHRIRLARERDERRQSRSENLGRKRDYSPYALR